jgi:DNA-binding PucR family transcriptional regulator
MSLGPVLASTDVPRHTALVTAAVIPLPIVDSMGRVAELLLADLDRIGADLDAEEFAVIPALATDAAIAAEVSASNRANARQLLTALARRSAEPTVEVPPEALDIVRTVVRRGIDLDVIYQAYRRGQHIVWRHWMTAAQTVVPAGPELVALLQVSSQLLFEFVDQVMGAVIAAAQHERAEVAGGALARRAETVRLILDGAPIATRRASDRLGYRLDRRHTALVVWAEVSPGPGERPDLGVCESAVTVLARAAGSPGPLTVPAGNATVWAWLGGHAEPDPVALRAALARVPAEVRVAVGPTLAGPAGFRDSHNAALEVQRLVGHLAGDGERLALHRELEVTALAGHDLDRAAEFVAGTLGPLAAATPNARRLRETLRVFLDEAENAPRAAARLHTHRNTVLQRVARATELLGRPPGEQRLATELALELAHRLGPRVLRG